MTSAGQASDQPFHLRFWGVRGSIPVASSKHLGIGGNTACMQVLTRQDEGFDELMIFDAGTGIRALGREIVSRPAPPAVIHIFFTHFHWDHIQGLPYFLPLFSARSKVIFHSAHSPERLREVLAAQMQAPYFPVFFDQLPAQLEFRKIRDGVQEFGPLSISTFPLHHPQGSVGFHISHRTKSAVYATDHEHGEADKDKGVLEVAEGADVLVYDAQYTPLEYETRHGWGHSTWLEATRMAKFAEVKELVLFHHDPERDDHAVRKIEEEARGEFQATHAAYEGLIL